MDFSKYLLPNFGKKVTHVVEMGEDVKYYSFGVEEHEDFQNFFREMEKNGYSIFETFHTKIIPVLFRILILNANQEMKRIIVGQSQKLIKETFEIEKISELCCVVNTDHEYIDLTFPYVRTDINILKGILKDNLKSLLERKNIKCEISSAFYEKNINVMRNGQFSVYKNVDNCNIINNSTIIGDGEEYELKELIRKFDGDYTIGQFMSFYFLKRRICKFQEKEPENITEKMILCLLPNAGYTELARILFEYYQYKFVFSGKTWYEYDGINWNEINGNITIGRIISDNLAEKFTSFLNKISNSNDNEIFEYIKICQKLISNLKNPSYKKLLITEASELFYNKLFTI